MRHFLYFWQALELKSGQDARIDIEGAEHGYAFIFSQNNLAGVPTKLIGTICDSCL